MPRMSDSDPDKQETETVTTGSAYEREVCVS